MKNTWRALLLMAAFAATDQAKIDKGQVKQMIVDLDPLAITKPLSSSNYNQTAVREIHFQDRALSDITSAIANCGSRLQELIDSINSFDLTTIKNNLSLGANPNMGDHAKNALVALSKFLMAPVQALLRCVPNIGQAIFGQPVDFGSNRAEVEPTNSPNPPGFLDTVAISISLSLDAGVLLSGSIEAGLAQELTGRGRTMAFIGKCLGFNFDAEIGVALNIGLWRKLDDITGDSTFDGVGVGIPGGHFGVGLDIVRNTDKELIGGVIAVDFGLGAGLSPVSLGLGLCNTSPWWMLDIMTQPCDADQSMHNWDCCKGSSCRVGEGDCDSDAECLDDSSYGPLQCGTDNCKSMLNSAWKDSRYDCCVQKCNAAQDQLDGCCTIDHPCPAGQGDCDYNHDCFGDLICGEDTCKLGFDTNFHHSFDCCVKGCFDFDIDYPGNDLYPNTVRITDTPQLCSDSCMADPNCFFWSWADENSAANDLHDMDLNKRCFLKSANSQQSSLRGLISGKAGAKDCRGCVQFDTDFPGSDLNGGLPKTNSWKECAERCQDNADCWYWTWAGFNFRVNWIDNDMGATIQGNCFLKSRDFDYAKGKVIHVEGSGVGKGNRKGLVSGKKSYKDCREPYVNYGDECWGACHAERGRLGWPTGSIREFACDYCGPKGVCKAIGSGSHKCKPADFKHEGYKCVKHCQGETPEGFKRGDSFKCEYCGSGGWCHTGPGMKTCKASP